MPHQDLMSDPKGKERSPLLLSVFTMNPLYTNLSADDAQELLGGIYGIIETTPSNGTGTNKDGLRRPATIAGNSDSAPIPEFTGNGNHWGWIDV
jgi:hypothetical protein